MGKVHLCPVCGKTFKRTGQLREHFFVHDNEVAKFTCEYCGRRFVNGQHFRGHLNSHTAVKESCKCGAKFTHPQSLNRHRKVCPAAGVEECPVYDCRICFRKFAKRENLKDHMKGKHGDNGSYKCECGQVFKWRSTLRTHRNKKLCSWNVLTFWKLLRFSHKLNMLTFASFTYEPRQANLCLRAFRHDKFQLRMSSYSEGPGIWLSVWRFLLTHCLYERAAKVLARLRGCAGSPEPSLLA